MKKEMPKDIIYIGLFANDSAKQSLYELAVDSDIEVGGQNINTLLILSDEFDTKEYYHHATLAFHSQADNAQFENVLDFYNENKGKEFEAKATHIGVNPSATAVAVKLDLGNIPCCNANPHITLITCRGGKPFQSNEITDWQPLAKPLALTLRCNAFFKG